VHRKPGKHRKPAKHRKPPKRAFAVVGATAVATVAVASGVASAAPDGQAHPATPAQPAHSGERPGVASANVPSQLAAVRARLATAEPHTLLAQEQRLAAAQLAAKRRAAARRAAALAAQQAAQRAAQQAAQPPASPAPSSAAPSGSPQQIAMAMLGSFGWSSSQFGCLQSLWNRESGWNPSATNPTSGAYGIPQALPGDKMASAGADWQTNPATQIRWGLGYIQQVYGSPCAAWSHEEAVGSY
jgi:Transglycosylase SLT domain